MSLAILFHFLCAQHVSDINISIIRSLQFFLLNYHIGRIILGSMCVGVSVWSGWCGVRVAGFSLQLWAHKKWDKIASDIKLVFYSSAVTLASSHIPSCLRIAFAACIINFLWLLLRGLQLPRCNWRMCLMHASRPHTRYFRYTHKLKCGGMSSGDTGGQYCILHCRATEHRSL